MGFNFSEMDIPEADKGQTWCRIKRMKVGDCFETVQPRDKAEPGHYLLMSIIKPSMGMIAIMAEVLDIHGKTHIIDADYVVRAVSMAEFDSGIKPN